LLEIFRRGRSKIYIIGLFSKGGVSAFFNSLGMNPLTESSSENQLQILINTPCIMNRFDTFITSARTGADSIMEFRVNGIVDTTITFLDGFTGRLAVVIERGLVTGDLIACRYATTGTTGGTLLMRQMVWEILA